MNVATKWVPPEPLKETRIVNVTPDSLSSNDSSDHSHQSSRQKRRKSQEQSSSRSKGSSAGGSSASSSLPRPGTSSTAIAVAKPSQPQAPLKVDLSGPTRRTSSDTVPTVAETATTTTTQSTAVRDSFSTIATETNSHTSQASSKTPTDDPNNTRKLHFYKTASQRKLQEQLSHHSSSPSASSTRSSLSSLLRLQEEEMDEGLHQLQVRKGIELARKSLTSMRKWQTPYDVDPPRRVRLASTRSIATTETSSTGYTSDSDPMVMERQIWNGIEALMADAFSEGGESVCTEDVLPKSLLRAMSHTSLFSHDASHNHSHLTPEEVDEIQMAQAALNSFMDMLLPSDDDDSQEAKRSGNGSNGSTMPSLETLRDSDSGLPQDQIAMAEVALHNFMDILLHDLETENNNSARSTTTSDHSSKVQILDLFQWSLKVNVDAQEKIRYLEAERQRLEDERQRELEELLETERRLEQERARRRMEEEKRRRKIRELEQHLAQEQRALAAANKKAYHAMKRNQYRQPPIPEDDEVWEAAGGKKPSVKRDDATRQQQRGMGSNDAMQRSMGDISNESESDRGYLPSPARVPEFEQEGSIPQNQADVKRMPSWGKHFVMASSDSVGSAPSHGSNFTNHLPSSFHENDAIRDLSDSDSSKKESRRRRFSPGSVAKSLSVGSSLDIPDLASINEDSVLNSVDSPAYVAKGDAIVRQYPGGVQRAPSATLKAVPSMRQRFERVPSSSGRIGLVSASADVYMDDVYRFSARKIVVDNNGSQEDEPDSKKRHTELLSVGSAGDIHQIVGSMVRFNESPDSSDPDDSSSSSSEDVTIDSGLKRDAQLDAKKPVPRVSRRYASGGKKQKLGGRLKRSLKAVRNRGKCVTNSWFCESANKRYGDISKQSKRLEEQHSMRLDPLASQRCLLHAEGDPYDRTHVLEPTRLTIDDTGFVVDQQR